MGRTYTAGPYDKWLKAAAEFIPDVVEPLKGPVKVHIEVICKKPAKPSNPYPVGDVDNLAKGPLDVITKRGVWLDDKQVVDMRVIKRYQRGREAPKTIVTISDAT